MELLKDTIDLMTSSDYKDRFKAEYHQLNIRCIHLDLFLENYKNDELTFKPISSIESLSKQLEIMTIYLSMLSKRAKVEGINLYE